MPAALEVPWTRIAAEAAAGAPLDELAEHYGVSINTLKARSAREGWKQIGRELAAKAQGPTVTVAKPQAGSMQPRATSGPGLIERLGNRARVSLLKTAVKGAVAFQKLPGEQVIPNAGQFKQLTDATEKIVGWSKGNDAPSLVSIHIAPQQAETAPVIDVTAEQL